MISDLLTTKELQDVLHVDRTTIYRMAESGRIPAVKVGNQWRFPRQQIELWLQRSNGTPVRDVEAAQNGAMQIADLLPLECVQLIQDSFAAALGVMILVTDLQGNLITSPSNPCGLYTAAETSPVARERCLSLWIDLANKPSLAPQFQESHLGLMCARGLVRVGSEIKAMLVMGGIAPEGWPPSDEKLARMSEYLELDDDLLMAHLDEVHRLDAEQQARVLPFVQRIADILSHIADERNQLFTRLQRIAEITKL
ncbi:MAG: PocR ligand-binding domain-containing protein [Anaerolineae bacterium]|nr:PocR ligand-binding domain-containing protein [Anaerolineae bacterium]MCB9130969.1 PocR ligand-binding domain-containing protein [Anaerolineales bacterium]MCB0228422.1 PocR ligand-binding domain-containing protein [Anaerolineae bacterium]MCB0238922.1 PocR ligand-binding domain-containing protein [Anaerolineae bacterium]MCB0250292.1 PocR ligand-binding domain-containing protein [Anaerolineae bacterium]